MYSLDTLHAIRLKGLALDVLLGCLPVALTLAAIGFVLTYVMFRTGREHGETAATLDRAAERYLSIGIGAWELAHGKMRMDPVYDQVLQAGILPPHGTIVDIGCGMGYMLAAAAAAGTNARLIGIELRSRIARRAASALAGDAEIYSADVLAAPLPACDAVLLFDVLHMMPSGDQRRLLSCIRAALRPGGVIVIREANRGGGWRFVLVRSGNWTRGLFEGRWRPHFKFRSTTEWEQELATAGFSVTIPMFDENQLLANFLMFARPIAADRLETIRTPVDVWPSAATR
jgi:SAM-dependent methyltransferase